jgi:hypothetical protein
VQDQKDDSSKSADCMNNQMNKRTVCRFLTPYKRSVGKDSSTSSSDYNTPLRSSSVAVHAPVTLFNRSSLPASSDNKRCNQLGKQLESTLPGRATSVPSNKDIPAGSTLLLQSGECSSFVGNANLVAEGNTDVNNDGGIVCDGSKSHTVTGQVTSDDGSNTTGKLVSDDISAHRRLARQNQLNRIGEKHKHTDIAINAGSYWLTRRQHRLQRISLKQAVGGARPSRLTPQEV